MAEMYKVAVALTLQDGVSNGLKSISKTLFGVGVAADATQASLRRLTLGIGGVMSAMAGAAAIKGTWDIVKAGGEVVNQLANMKSLGMTNLQITQATVLAYKELSVHGATVAGNLKAYQEVRAVMANDAEASAALDPFLKAQFVTMSRGEDASKLIYALKSLDMQGAFVTNGKLDPSKMSGALNAVNAVDALTQGLLTPQQMMQFTRLAGPAASMMDTYSYLRDNYEVMQTLGPTGGRGESMAIKTFVGGQVSKALAEHLEALGLVAPGGITKDHGQYSIKPGALKDTGALLHGGLTEWFYNTVLPAMKAHGFTMDSAGLAHALGPTDQTTMRYFNMLLTNRAQIEAGMAKFDVADQQNQYAAASTSFAGAVTDLGNAMVSVWQSLGTPAAQMVVPWMEGFANELNKLSSWLYLHPNITKNLVVGLGALGVALIGFGAILLGAAIVGIIGSSGVLAAIGVGVMVLATALTAANWKAIAKDFSGAIVTFEHGIQRIIYDLTHPGQLLKDMTQPAAPAVPYAPSAPPGFHWVGGGRGGRFVSNSSTAGSLAAPAHEAWAAISKWVDAGAPVTVQNPKDIAKATTQVVHKQITSKQTGRTGGSPRAHPLPSAAASLGGLY